MYLDCYSAPQNMTLTLLNATQTPVATAVSGAPSNPIASTLTAGATYYLEVSNGTGPYTVKVTSP
jgi:hypothetical protein